MSCLLINLYFRRIEEEGEGGNCEGTSGRRNARVVEGLKAAYVGDRIVRNGR